MDRTWRFRCDVAWNAIGPGELPKQPQHPVSAALDIRKSLRIGAFEIAMRDQPRTAVAGPDDIDHVQIALFDQTVEMDIDEVEPGGSPPMPKQTRFDVFELERGFEQRIVLKINLPDREVIGGAPIRVHFFQQIGRQRIRHQGLLTGSFTRHARMVSDMLARAAESLRPCPALIKHGLPRLSGPATFAA